MIPSQAQHLNLQVWQSLVQKSGSSSYLVEMIDHFFFIGPMRISRIRNSFEVLDLQSLASEAKTLKTAAQSLGLDELARLVARLEADAVASSLEQLPKTIPAIETMLADALNELKQFRIHL